VPPLTWDEVMPPPHGTLIPQWAAGRGFEVLMAGDRQMITGVEIVPPDAVKITCTNDLTTGEVVVQYAATAEGGTPPGPQTARWGHLRDSDTTAGSLTGAELRNYCVAFQLPVP
jgi:hypothetical protein